jgi:hypothetical protein
MKRGKYEYLREQYPDMISLEQFYRICRISKRSALYLLTNSIVPFTDTGRKTWRYRISIGDVIKYLRVREKVGSLIPAGAVSSRRKRPENTQNPSGAFAEHIKQFTEAELRNYFIYVFTEYPDMLSAAEIMEMTGFCKKTVLRYIRTGYIDSIKIASKYLIPKPTVIGFMASQKYIEGKDSSPLKTDLLHGFVLWSKKHKEKL